MTPPPSADASRSELQRLLAELERVRATLTGELPEDGSEQAGNVDPSTADAAGDLVDADREQAMLEGTAQRIAEVQAALTRLDEGGYGRCVDCGEPIPPARLEARPEAARCVGCQHKREDAA